MAEKPHMNLVFIGHVDHGKSTLVGRLLLDTGAIEPHVIEKFRKDAEAKGKATFEFAWVMDHLKEERERGVTIDVAHRRFDTDKYYFTIIDAPGHRDFVKNMITGASQADCALLVVSAKKGEFEAGIGPGGQTREHAYLAKTLGVDQIVVAVNKMDDPSVNWSKERYEEIKKEVSALLKTIGYRLEKVPFVPVSAWTGDNIVTKSDKMPWYDGPTLVEALDTFEVPPKPIDKPLRIPIQDVYSITGVGTVPVGRVETGVLKEGDTVIFEPPGIKGEVKSIEMHHERISQAEPGDNIGFNVKGVSRKDIRRGDVAGHPTNPPTVVKEFIGRIFVVWHPTAIAAGYTPVLHAHTAHTPVRFEQLIAKLDPRTGQVVQENPSIIKQGEAAIVKFVPLKPIVLEKYEEIKPLGRFAIRDMGRTVAVGIVQEVTPAK